MTDLQMIDWLKAGMKIALREKLQGEDFLTPQDLLHHAQSVERDNAVLDARKRQLLAFPTTSPCHSNIPKKLSTKLLQTSFNFISTTLDVDSLFSFVLQQRIYSFFFISSLSVFSPKSSTYEY